MGCYEPNNRLLAIQYAFELNRDRNASVETLLSDAEMFLIYLEADEVAE